MALDGWSLNKKLDKVRDELVNEITELKMNFTALYEYLRRMEESKKDVKAKGDKKDARKSRKKVTLH